MASAPNDVAAADLGRLFGAGTASGMTDRQLIDRLARKGGDRDEVDLALRAILDRHGSLVWGTCRQVLGNVPDAEDAFQATFLVLLRKAGSLSVSDSLGPWLHQVASRVSRRASSVRARDRARLAAAAGQPGSPGGDPAPATDRLLVLHGELDRLPDKYRMPLVLCHLQGKTHEEAARALRWPVGTLSGRLSRARSLLRSRLERRGWRSSGDIVGVLTPVCSRTIVPPDLVARAAGLTASFQAGLPAPLAIEGLTRGVLMTMLWNRCKGPAAALFTVVAMAGASSLSVRALGAGRAGGPSPDRPGPADAPVLVASAAPQTPSPGPQPEAARPDGVSNEDVTIAGSPAVVVRTVPEAGTGDVDPALKQIKVTFSKEMRDGNWSWVTISKPSFPEITGKIHYLDDHRTCVLPVKLEPGRTYAIWLNTTKFTNFKDRDRRPAVPYLLVFRTKA
ncbi:ECF RNA polymerase sigma factor SigW [Aquisphaera giovannonii]|uniref:ECF RNA polymerase sigma factor SigW n=1 Tax=Aquisphaera giovannonii TaxID=406548 RepID=A0A5B9W6Z3_9BACT|nr:sigma-70 family RNA polymerase sigma factor [Aquisphaera giovannonii]QEH36338.1 ECF RNA polymerase sigma factor SigW [Aquisphaera giovannonii]